MLKGFLFVILAALPLTLASPLQSDTCKDSIHPVLRCDCVQLEVNKGQNSSCSSSDESHHLEKLSNCAKHGICHQVMYLRSEGIQACPDGTVFLILRDFEPLPNGFESDGKLKLSPPSALPMSKLSPEGILPQQPVATLLLKALREGLPETKTPALDSLASSVPQDLTQAVISVTVQMIQLAVNFALMILLIWFLFGGLRVALLTAKIVLKGAIDKNLDYLRCWRQWIKLLVTCVIVSLVTSITKAVSIQEFFNIVLIFLVLIVLNVGCFHIIKKFIRRVRFDDKLRKKSIS